MHIDTGTLSAILLAIVGGGGLAPLLWRWWVRNHPRAQEDKKVKAEIEQISSSAARETIEGMRGAMTALRQALTDGHAEVEQLRAERDAHRARIGILEAKINELVDQVRALGGTVEGLPEVAS